MPILDQTLILMTETLIPQKKSMKVRVSVQGVESLWGDCRFIPEDWGS